MKLEEFLAVFKDNAEATAYAKTMTSDSTANVERIGLLEKDLSKAIDKREAMKKDPDGALQKEVDTINGVLKAEIESHNVTKAKFESESNITRMSDTLRDLKIEAQNGDALKAISALALDGANYKDGFSYSNEDKTTKFNGNKPYSVLDRINELKDSDKSYLFKVSTGAGAKTTDQNIKSGKPSVSDIVSAGLKY